MQDKLRGLKKQITNIKVIITESVTKNIIFYMVSFIWFFFISPFYEFKDKTYEEGIINNLRALELRLECELAEEEEKSWPLQNKEQK